MPLSGVSEPSRDYFYDENHQIMYINQKVFKVIPQQS